MTKTKYKYRVRYVESERGWGQDFWHTDYDTPEKAQAAIDRCRKRNEEDYARTKVVPDVYIQTLNDVPELVLVKASKST